MRVLVTGGAGYIGSTAVEIMRHQGFEINVLDDCSTGHADSVPSGVRFVQGSLLNENEIAQAEAKTGKQFAKYWIHHGLLTINGQKMSKSSGNFITIKKALEDYHPDVLKMFYLLAHYSSAIDFSEKRMEEVVKRYRPFVFLFDKSEELSSEGLPKLISEDKKEIDEFKLRFEKAMDDDFHTEQAFVVLKDIKTYSFSLLPKEILNKNLAKFKYAVKTLLDLCHIFGLSPDKTDILDLRLATDSGLKDTIRETNKKVKEINDLVAERTKYRKEKNFGESDRIKRELEKKGVKLEDNEDGTTRWSWK